MNYNECYKDISSYKNSYNSTIGQVEKNLNFNLSEHFTSEDLCNQYFDLKNKNYPVIVIEGKDFDL